jgi:hypothetical protein
MSESVATLPLAEAYTVISTSTVEPKPQDDDTEKQNKDSYLLVVDSDAALAAAEQASDKFQASLLSLSSEVALNQPRMLPQDNFRVLTPNQALVVSQTVQFMYNRPGDQALRVFKNSILRRIYWVETFSYRNLTDSPVGRDVESTSELTLSSGREANTEIGISASFRGLGLSFGAGHRTFQARETTERRTETVRHTIPPRQSLYLYQRHYEFEDVFWWTLDAWNEIWTVGVQGGHTPLTSSIRVTIAADEFMGRTEPVINQTLGIAVQSFAGEVRPGQFRVRQFQNTTSLAQQHINRLRAQLVRP